MMDDRPVPASADCGDANESSPEHESAQPLPQTAAAAATTARAPTPAPVADVLLSLAKSSRYVATLSHLLGDLVAPYLVRAQAQAQNNSSASASASASNPSMGTPPRTATWDLLAKLRPELDLAAALLHALLVIARTGRSVGMEMADLTFGKAKVFAGSGSNHHGAAGANAGGSLSGRGQGGEKTFAKADAKPIAPQSAFTITGGRNTSRRNQVDCKDAERQDSILADSKLRLATFVMLTIVPPYLLARFGRTARDGGGWNELRSLFVPTSAAPPGSNSGSLTLGPEHLRGQSRREIFEERRRRMIQLASRIENEDEVRDDFLAQNGALGPSPLNSNLHLQRRTRFQRLKARYLKLLSLLREKTYEWIRQSRFAVSSLPADPHAISAHRAVQFDEMDSADSRASLIKWLIRLNLALYYLDGNSFPTLAHRFSGTRIQTGSPSRSDKQDETNVAEVVSPSLADRPSYRIIGALILAEGGVLLAGGINQLLVNVVHRWQIRRRPIGGRLSNSNGSEYGESERRRIIKTLEEAVPSIHTYNERSSEGKNNLERVSDQEHSSATCGICMHERNHSAAPIACGHVFCWSCILHWVTTVRPECPLCRSPAKGQDILALCNY